MNQDKIAHYRIVRQLGAGGMGLVYEAEDTKLGRRVRIWHHSGMVLHARSIGDDVHVIGIRLMEYARCSDEGRLCSFL